LRGCCALVSFVTLGSPVQSFNSKSGNLKKPARRGETVTVGRVEDVPEGRGATVELLEGTELALYHVNGQFYAIENFCPHKGAPLAEGQLCGAVVECDWHGWRFDLRTGACLNHPHSSVEAYEVSIEDGWIKIAI
jgi:3-phenylpropionate/trans-cinnamate dioxygenase ferredoxin component